MSNHQEAAFTTKFRLWVKRNMPTAAYEIKHTRGLLEFQCRELREHQYYSLLAANSDSLPLVYKIPDDGRAHKPFDMVSLAKVPAYVVICYPKRFVMIPIRAWPPDLKKLKVEEAEKLATYSIPLTDL